MKKSKKELRERIMESVNRLECRIYLTHVLEVAELYRKSLDKDDFRELSDLQWEQKKAICSILTMEEAETVSNINYLIAAFIQ